MPAPNTSGVGSIPDWPASPLPMFDVATAKLPETPHRIDRLPDTKTRLCDNR